MEIEKMKEKIENNLIQKPTPDNSVLADHYDKTYRENPKTFGNGKIEPFILEATLIIPPDGKVIELGAGQGRNALELAKKGFQVTAVDISQVGVDSMNKKAQELGFPNFHAKVLDSREALATDEEYDLIVSTFMLHHLSREDAEKLITKIKERTKKGGINAIATFTVEGDFAKSPNAKDRFYPRLGEVRELYESDGWEIIKYGEKKRKSGQIKPDGSPMFNIRAEIIAKKKA